MAITKLNSLAIPDDTIVEADLSYPLTGFSSTGIDDNATSTAITIDSDENVGIGISSLVNPLQVGVTSNTASKTSGSAFDGGALRLDGGLGAESSEVAILGGANDGLSSAIGFARQSSADWGTQLRFYTHSTAITTTDELTERMRIDASGRLLLNITDATTGSQNPTVNFKQLSNASYHRGMIIESADSDAFIGIGYSGSEFQIGATYRASAGYKPITVTVGGYERMRIDTSGNALVGTTSVAGFLNSTTETGSISYSDGKIAATASSDAAAYFKRLTDDGPIITFRNSSAANLGSIGTKSNGLYIGSDDAGIFFNDHGGGDLDAIFPYDVGTNTFYNGHVDIGGSSNKFRNIHISGSLSTGDGVTFGSTGGSVTSKTLDDYEEGTWTPTVTTFNGTVTPSSARYTKIGQHVTVHVHFQWSNNQNNNSGQFFFGGLPYNLATSQHYVAGSIGYTGGVDITDWYLIGLFNSDSFYFTKKTVSGNVTNAEVTTKGLGYIICSMSYITDS